MTVITKKELDAMDQRYRVNFINSLSGFKSVNLVGTVCAKGHSNLAPFSSVVHLGADPALVGMVSRPDSVLRGSLKNIIDTGWYSLNHVSESMLDQAHQCSARYGENESEFAATGLKAVYSELCTAPMVAESQLSMLVEYKEHHRLDINNTVFVIGQIREVHLPKQAIQASGLVDLDSLGSLVCTGLDTYHSTQRIKRLAYAKPDKPLQEVDPKA